MRGIFIARHHVSVEELFIAIHSTLVAFLSVGLSVRHTHSAVPKVKTTESFVDHKLM